MTFDFKGTKKHQIKIPYPKPLGFAVKAWVWNFDLVGRKLSDFTGLRRGK